MWCDVSLAPGGPRGACVCVCVYVCVCVCMCVCEYDLIKLLINWDFTYICTSTYPCLS